MSQQQENQIRGSGDSSPSHRLTVSPSQPALAAAPVGVTGAVLARRLFELGVVAREMSTITIKNWRDKGMPAVWDDQIAGYRFDVEACAVWVKGQRSERSKRHGGVREGAGRRGAAKGQMANGKSQMANEEKAEPTPCPLPPGGVPNLGPRPSALGPSLPVQGYLADLVMEMEERRTLIAKAEAEGKRWEGAGNLPVKLVEAYFAGEDVWSPAYAEVQAQLTVGQREKFAALQEERQNALKYKREMGDLVEREDVETALTQHAVAVREAIDAMPDLVAAALSAQGCSAAVIEAAQQAAAGVVAAVIERVREKVEIGEERAEG